MVDTFRPLALGEAGTAADDGGYAWTWSGREPGTPASPVARPAVG
jgi:homogentisate 1,2-dioxygenase